MTAVVFVDTNVLIYARDQQDANKHDGSRIWMEHLWVTRTGRLSFQVLQEYYVNVTQKLAPGLSRLEARQDVERLFAWEPQPMTEAGMSKAWSVQDAFKLSWWDSLIVSSALLEGCTHLLTEDMHDGLSIEGMLIVNPFLHDPDVLKLPVKSREERK